MRQVSKGEERLLPFPVESKGGIRVASTAECNSLGKGYQLSACLYHRRRHILIFFDFFFIPALVFMRKYITLISGLIITEKIQEGEREGCLIVTNAKNMFRKALSFVRIAA